MTVTTSNEATNHIVLQMSPVIDLSEDSLFEFCQLNSHLRIERTATGELIIMSSAGSEIGNRNAKLMQQLAIQELNIMSGGSVEILNIRNF